MYFSYFFCFICGFIWIFECNLTFIIHWAQLRKAKYTRKDELHDLGVQEEGLVFSQAIHFCNRMVYLKVPLDTSRGMPLMPHGEETASSYLSARYVSPTAAPTRSFPTCN